MYIWCSTNYATLTLTGTETVYVNRPRSVHTELPSYGSSYVDGQNEYATHSARHRDRQKTTLRESFVVNRASGSNSSVCN